MSFLGSGIGNLTSSIKAPSLSLQGTIESQVTEKFGKVQELAFGAIDKITGGVFGAFSGLMLPIAVGGGTWLALNLSGQADVISIGGGVGAGYVAYSLSQFVTYFF